METAAGSSLPWYLARHAPRGFDDEDVAALVDAIDSSQASQSSSPLQLPAELLLQILDHVPVDYILEWRQVCRAFRDAIDGRIMYGHLQRTELIGIMGTQESFPLSDLRDEEFDQIHQLRARFIRMESASSRPIWTNSHAVFEIENSWYMAFREIGGAEARQGDTVEDADTRWLNTLDRLELRRPEEGYGSLRWCIKLDHAVLDLDFPLEAGRNALDIEVHVHRRIIRVPWKEMLIRFLKSEMQLRCAMQKHATSSFTFSHDEDCLRSVRRQRLHASLNPDNKVDRHIKWSLRLLRPLFGKPRADHTLALADVEDKATHMLLLLRREAAMTVKQLAYLLQLKEEHQIMEAEVQNLENEFKEFKSHLSPPSVEFTLPSLGSPEFRPPRNPVAWSDDVRAAIEERVDKWRSQKKVIRQVHALLSASNQALAVLNDSFDNLDSEI